MISKPSNIDKEFLLELAMTPLSLVGIVDHGAKTIEITMANLYARGFDFDTVAGLYTQRYGEDQTEIWAKVLLNSGSYVIDQAIKLLDSEIPKKQVAKILTLTDEQIDKIIELATN